ncbi:helix-turn-helix transcriptional regulator [Cellvibrio sp. ARAG 10.3]|uniref:helix-turn-helix transcriptional regulator n=1 Tax=Cellvibrio sp. ARAG 10.3 TaxID=3451358 RepID=UPI003F4727E4
MPKPHVRTYSRHSLYALELMGNLIREGRITAKLTTTELAERAGISRSLLQRIEKGDPGCAIGVVFEVATIIGLPLFSEDTKSLAVRLDYSKEKQSLLPKAVRRSNRVVKDDF